MPRLTPNQGLLVLLGVLALSLGLLIHLARGQEQSGGTAQRLRELREQSSVAFEAEAGRITAIEGYLLIGAAAPFTCDATHVGVYVDTTCNQLCVCLPSAAKWGRSDTGVLGSATDCCV